MSETSRCVARCDRPQGMVRCERDADHTGPHFADTRQTEVYWPNDVSASPPLPSAPAPAAPPVTVSAEAEKLVNELVSASHWVGTSDPVRDLPDRLAMRSARKLRANTALLAFIAAREAEVARLRGERATLSTALGRVHHLVTGAEDGVPITPDQTVAGVARLTREREAEKARADAHFADGEKALRWLSREQQKTTALERDLTALRARCEALEELVRRFAVALDALRARKVYPGRYGDGWCIAAASSGALYYQTLDAALAGYTLDGRELPTAADLAALGAAALGNSPPAPPGAPAAPPTTPEEGSGHA